MLNDVIAFAAGGRGLKEIVCDEFLFHSHAVHLMSNKIDHYELPVFNAGRAVLPAFFKSE